MTKQRAESSETWTRELTEFECNRRGWELRHTSWRAKLPREKFYRTFDLFGFVDCVARPPGGGTVAIQFTDVTNMSKRAHKARAANNYEFVRSMGWGVVVWGWRADGRLREEWLTEPVR